MRRRPYDLSRFLVLSALKAEAGSVSRQQCYNFTCTTHKYSATSLLRLDASQTRGQDTWHLTRAGPLPGKTANLAEAVSSPMHLHVMHMHVNACAVTHHACSIPCTRTSPVYQLKSRACVNRHVASIHPSIHPSIQFIQHASNNMAAERGKWHALP